MEKHCERQHGMVSPGGRVHFLSSSDTSTIELPSISSPFQQVRTYPAPTGMKFVPKTGLSNQVIPTNGHDDQPRVFHSGTRAINTYQRRRKSSLPNANPTESQRPSFVCSRPLPDSLINDPVPLTLDNETPEQKRERILADSRKISMPIRPVGRPRKGSVQLYKDAEMASSRKSPYTSSQNNLFDLEQEDLTQICVQTERNYPQCQEFAPLQPAQETEQVSFPKVAAKGMINTKELIQMETSDGKLVYLLPAKTMNSQSSNLNFKSQQKTGHYISTRESPTITVEQRLLSDSITPSSKLVGVSAILDENIYPSKILLSSDQQKVKEVEALEAKLSNYQNVVEKYEKLAEDATTAAIDERKTQLRILEEQLRKREQTAKNKLANAINVIEDSQVIENTICAIATEQADSENEIDTAANNMRRTKGSNTPTTLTSDVKIIEPNSNKLHQDRINQRNLRSRQQVKNNNELVLDRDRNSTAEKYTLQNIDTEKSNLVNSLTPCSLEHELSRDELHPVIENQSNTKNCQQIKQSEKVVTDLDKPSCNEETSLPNECMETSDLCDSNLTNHLGKESSRKDLHLDSSNQRVIRTRRKIKNDEKVVVDLEKSTLEESTVFQKKDTKLSDSSNSSKISAEEKQEPRNTGQPKGNKRGRKRKIPEVEVNADNNVSKGDIKKTPTKTPKITSLQCGKCLTSTDSYPSVAKFKDHAIREHGGIARPLGEPQEFASEEETHALLKEAFSYKKQVSCYQCMQKKFTSFGGLKMHLLTCGKSKEECDALKVKCQHCSFRTYKHCMPAHLSGKHRGGNLPDPKDKKLDETDDAQQLTPSGRVKRKAASNANKKVVQAFKDIDDSIDRELCDENKDIDGAGDGDDIDDEEYNIASEIESQDIRKMYSDFKTKGVINTKTLRFACHRCKFKSKNRIQIEDHIIKKHSVQTLESLNEEEDSYDSADELNEEYCSQSEDDEVDYKDSNARTSNKKSKKLSILKSPGKEIGFKAPPLYHDKEMIEDEMKFRESNYCEDGTLFPELNTNISDWIRLDPSEMKKYVPTSTEKSVPFCIMDVNSVGDNANNTKRLNCFDTHINSDKSSATFYTGGPIWTGDWCPLNSKSEQTYDVIALSVDMNFETETKLTPEVTKDIGASKGLPTNSLLQLWSCSLDIAQPEIAIQNKPRMKIGLVHDFGKIWCLKWCPSGCETTKDGNISSSYLPRLGILAAACADGSVRLFSIPKLCYVVTDEEECVLYKVKMNSVVTLCHNGINLKDKTLNPACLSISWFKSLGHRVIAGAYSDGNISIWDIDTKSVLLKTKGNAHIGPIIYPYMFFRAHLTGVKISLDFGTESLNDASKSADKLKTNDNEDFLFPRYLATGSSDRVFAIWDLSDGVTAGSMGTIVPIRQFRRHLISNIVWMHNYPGHVSVAHDDIYAHANTRSAIVDVTSANFAELRKRDDERQLSCGQYSATCQNSAIFSQAFCPMKNILASSTAAGDLIIHVGLNPHGRRGATFKNDKHMQQRRCPIYRSELKYNKDVPYLQFIDMPLKDLSKIPSKEREMQRSDELMAQEHLSPTNLLPFPLAQINLVNLNPNLRSSFWIFSGHQSGFGRLHNIKSLTR